MRKFRGTILSAVVVCALCATGTTFSCAQNFSVSAQSRSVSATLVAPTSYEQYLALNAPSSIAATENYTAIADGKKLYVYDRENDKYLTYDGHSIEIESLQFDGNGNLYFLADLCVYRLSLEDLKNGNALAEQLPGLSCTSFVIQSNTLYYTTLNNIWAYSLSEEKKDEEALTTDRQIENALAYAKEGSLYYLCKNTENPGSHILYSLNLQTKSVTPISEFDLTVRSMTVANNLLCFTTENGAFYSYNRSALTVDENAQPLTKEENDYVSLCSTEDSVYAIRGKTVRHYAVETESFTDFEIGASSTSHHRLNGASELLLYENNLFIADDENDRISVYNTESGIFERALDSVMDTPYLAAYEKTLLVSSSSETALYSLSAKTYGEELLKLEDEDIQGNVIGATSVYGRFYLLTDDNHCYSLDNESGEWTWEESKKSRTYAVAFTSDVYGSLYVAYDNGDVYRFTEKEFFNPEASGTKIASNLQSPEKIVMDYESNLYALLDGVLTKYTQSEGGMYELNSTYSPNYNLVNDDTPRVISFAFGVKSAETYFLYDGDYIVSSDELDLPTVNPISVGNAAELIFGESNAEFSVVMVEDNSILIEFDVGALQTATKFPYVAFKRSTETQRALKLGEEGEYSILIAQDSRTGAYKTYLALNTVCTALPETEYKTVYTESKIGYLTNDVSVYKFPYLNELLSTESLTGGTKVTLLSEVRELDYAYYQISYMNTNGEIKTGYIPKPYITLFDGSTPVPETIVSGKTETDTDGVWRVTYLILGFGAITILVDFLLLRKPKEE